MPPLPPLLSIPPKTFLHWLGREEVLPVVESRIRTIARKLKLNSLDKVPTSVGHCDAV